MEPSDLFANEVENIMKEVGLGCVLGCVYMHCVCAKLCC